MSADAAMKRLSIESQEWIIPFSSNLVAKLVSAYEQISLIPAFRTELSSKTKVSLYVILRHFISSIGRIFLDFCKANYSLLTLLLYIFFGCDKA